MAKQVDANYDCYEEARKEKERLKRQKLAHYLKLEEKENEDFEQRLLKLEKEDYAHSDELYNNHMAKYRPKNDSKALEALNWSKYNCPKWCNFLNEVFLGDQDMLEYVQKFAGSLLYNGNPEQSLYVLYGSGGNGKTTFLDIIKKVLQEHNWFELDSDILTKTKFKISRNIGENLQNCRIAIIKEPEKRIKYHTSTIKSITGGGIFKVSEKEGGFMQEHVFIPNAKLIFETNYIPEFTDNNHAIERRVKIIPFKKTILPYERNKSLKSELEKELPEIEKWMQDGLKKWRTDEIFTEPLYMEDYKSLLNIEKIKEPELAYAFSKLKRDYSAGLTIANFYQFAHALGCISDQKDKKGKELSEKAKKDIQRYTQTKIGKYLKDLCYCTPVIVNGDKVFLGLNFSKEELNKETDKIVYDFSFKDQIKLHLTYDKDNKAMIDFFTQKEYEYQMAVKCRKNAINIYSTDDNNTPENSDNDTVTNSLHSEETYTQAE